MFLSGLHFTQVQWTSIDRVPKVAKEAIKWLQQQPPPAVGYWADFCKTLEKSDPDLAIIFLLGKWPGYEMVIDC
jgi:hypothetical protein